MPDDETTVTDFGLFGATLKVPKPAARINATTTGFGARAQRANQQMRGSGSSSSSSSERWPPNAVSNTT